MPKYYFAYGSNLSITQMKQRCPTSPLHQFPVAILAGYDWVISPRGYANIVKNTRDDTSDYPRHEKKCDTDHKYQGCVLGLLYELSPKDEMSLDSAEGVPWAYEKVECEVYNPQNWGENLEGAKSPGWNSVRKSALVYIDPRGGVDPELSRAGGVVADEYVQRMKRGIKEATKFGMDLIWFKREFGKYIEWRQLCEPELEEELARHNGDSSGR